MRTCLFGPSLQVFFFLGFFYVKKSCTKLFVVVVSELSCFLFWLQVFSARKSSRPQSDPGGCQRRCGHLIQETQQYRHAGSHRGEGGNAAHGSFSGWVSMKGTTTVCYGKSLGPQGKIWRFFPQFWIIPSEFLLFSSKSRCFFSFQNSKEKLFAFPSYSDFGCFSFRFWTFFLRMYFFSFFFSELRRFVSDKTNLDISSQNWLLLIIYFFPQTFKIFSQIQIFFSS